MIHSERKTVKSVNLNILVIPNGRKTQIPADIEHKKTRMISTQQT